MRARIDINEVEVQTKIRAKYLRAIENEEWDLLPGDVYVRSFLRTYGDYLGLDTRALLDDYRRQHESPADQEPRPIAPATRDRDRSPRGAGGPRIPSWAIIGAVLIAVVVALYLVGRQTGSNKPGTGTSASRNSHHRRPGRRSRRHAVILPSTPTKVKLKLIPTGQVYVCLVDGAGKRLIPGVIYSPGQTIPVKSASKMLLTLGNASVQMKVNGVPVPVSASSGAIGYELLPHSHRLLPTALQPRCA
jgi:cytoskeleton protein RodZ